MPSTLAYHQLSTDYFRQQNSVWSFFSNFSHREEQLKEFKTDLLKNTYKFDVVADTGLFQKVSIAKEKLGLDLPVYLYQAQHTEEMNASIVYLHQEVHIVFSGKILELLNEEELLAIIGHELSHVQLYTQLNGDTEVADRIITAIANHPESTPAHYETARLFKLYTEIFCDRGAYEVTGSYAAIISSLVKIATGLKTVNPDSYIKQAEEIFASDSSTKTMGVSHPENFIRARAIWLWHQKGSEADHEIRQMIEGAASFDELDLFRQQQVASITERLIRHILYPAWIQTPFILSLAKQYFSQIVPENHTDTSELARETAILHGNLTEYLAYVLYDFATADKQLEDVPLGYCFFLSDELKIDKAFAAAVKKERKLTDKKVTILKKNALSEYQASSMNFLDTVIPNNP